MDLRDDERAQTVQVGAILLLGTLVIALAVYQVTSVPGQNGATEFTHNQDVHEQLQELRTAIGETAAEGTGRSATVVLGTRYRDRIVAVNPGPPSGTLRTTDLGAVGIENAVAAGNRETADFWNGSDKRYATSALTYEPNYNEYRNAPTTVYEHSVLANRFENARNGDRTLLLSNETIIDGREITLVTLDGSLSESGSGTTPVDTRPLSVSRTTIPIRNASGGPVMLTLSTTLPESRWLALVGNEAFVEGISYTEGTPRNRVTIRFDPGETYRLRMAKVGVGSGGSLEPATYLTTLPSRGRPVAENDTRRVVLEVRDRYNNPVANESVNLTVMTTDDGTQPGELSTDDERGDTVRVRTDERGRASATYRAPTAIDGDPVRVTVGASRTETLDPAGPLDPRSPNVVRFAFAVTNADGSPVPYEIEWNRTALAAQPDVECGSAGCTYDRSTGSLSVPIRTSPATPDAAFGVRSDDRVVATVTAETDRTRSDGTASTRIDVVGSGTVELSVSSGESSDTLSLTSRNQAPNAAPEFSPETPATGDLVSFDANATDPDGRNGELEYAWAFGDGSRGFGPTPQHVYTDPGTYDVSLTVTDANGATTTANRTITVSNRSPTAEIDVDPVAPLTDETVVFDASGSTDPDGSDGNLSYEWDLDGDGTFEASGERVTRTYADDGERTVTLEVTDEDGGTSSTTATVTVRNHEPVTDFYYTPSAPTTGEKITFDASDSTDPDGEVASYEWTLTYPDGRTETTTGETITANPLPPGTYRMTLTVTDDDGDSATTSETFSVRAGRSAELLSADFESGSLSTDGWSHRDTESSPEAGVTQDASN